MKITPLSLKQLPQKPETWFFCQRTLAMELDGELANPTVLALVNLTDLQILQLNIYESAPDPAIGRDLLLQAMDQPGQGGISPHRPKTVMFEQADLMDASAPALREIKVEASLGQAPPIIDSILSELAHAFVHTPAEVPGLLSVPGTNPKMIASLFEAASQFYRAAPWKIVADFQTMAVTIDPPGEEFFVQVMGNGGMEFGLSLYRSWEDVLGMFEFSNSPMDVLPEAGMHGLTFEAKADLPDEDQAALRRYGWKTAGSKACPMPVIFTRDGGVERPPRQELLHYEALLRGLPGFIKSHLVPDGQGDFLPAEAVIETQNADGPVRLTIRYPAGEMPDFEGDGFWSDVPLQSLELPEALQQANRLADQAWQEADAKKRLELARQALALSPDCCEACLVLAYEAESPEEGHEWLEKAVQAGARALGQEFLDQNAGYLWSWPDAQPYLRALDGLGESLEKQGETEKALELYQTLLDLNEDDHQGARYRALRLLLQLNRNDEAAELLEAYETDGTANWAYGQALLAFRQHGDVARSRTALRRALQTNRYVPAYLSGAKPLPEEAPEAIGFGDVSEAIDYALGQYALWWSTPGAVDWLKKRG
jgi:tetratricopeptide (TPR) repeat protein